MRGRRRKGALGRRKMAAGKEGWDRRETGKEAGWWN